MWVAEEQNWRKIWVFAIVISLQITSNCLSATFSSNHVVHHQKDENPVSKPAGMVRNEEQYRGLSTLGSRPPNCDHRCEGCNPCEAIQVPATTDDLGIQSANYEPEGWKCKCGASFFNP